MFGYIAINKAEMKFKDYDMYQAYYCGLCRRIKECYGKRGQLTLSYDMTFLIVLLTGLYEPKTVTGETRCIAHPLEKHPTKINEYTDYAASMNLILSYYKCKDDWTDERKKKGYIAAKALEPKIKKIESIYETGGLGYTKLHCAPHLMHFAPSAALSGYPIYHLDVLAVI